MVLDEQVQYLDVQSLIHLGEWLARRFASCRTKREEANKWLTQSAVAVEVLRVEWAAQIASQTRPLPRAYTICSFTSIADQGVQDGLAMRARKLSRLSLR